MGHSSRALKRAQRAEQLLAWCRKNDINVIVGLEPDKPEDITDIDRALQARQPVDRPPKVGRNDPCPCGSAKKFKKCCEGHTSDSV